MSDVTPEPSTRGSPSSSRRCSTVPSPPDERAEAEAWLERSDAAGPSTSRWPAVKAALGGLRRGRRRRSASTTACCARARPSPRSPPPSTAAAAGPAWHRRAGSAGAASSPSSPAPPPARRGRRHRRRPSDVLRPPIEAVAAGDGRRRHRGPATARGRAGARAAAAPGGRRRRAGTSCPRGCASTTARPRSGRTSPPTRARRAVIVFRGGVVRHRLRLVARRRGRGARRAHRRGHRGHRGRAGRRGHGILDRVQRGVRRARRRSSPATERPARGRPAGWSGRGGTVLPVVGTRVGAGEVPAATAMRRRLAMRRRSRSEHPPQTPWSMRFSRAYSRHGLCTGQVAQMRAGGVDPGAVGREEDRRAGRRGSCRPPSRRCRDRSARVRASGGLLLLRHVSTDEDGLLSVPGNRGSCRADPVQIRTAAMVHLAASAGSFGHCHVRPSRPIRSPPWPVGLPVGAAPHAARPGPPPAPPPPPVPLPADAPRTGPAAAGARAEPPRRRPRPAGDARRCALAGAVVGGAGRRRRGRRPSTTTTPVIACRPTVDPRRPRVGPWTSGPCSTSCSRRSSPSRSTAPRARGVFEAAGSGVVISDDGLDPHQRPRRRRRPDESRCGSPTAAPSPAELVGSFPDDDVALIQVSDRDGLTPAKLGDSRRPAGRRRGRRHRQRPQPRRPAQRHRGASSRRWTGRSTAEGVIARQPHPDRRRHQPRQLRRAAGQRRRHGRRHQHRDHRRRPEHRLRHRDRRRQAAHRRDPGRRRRDHAGHRVPRRVAPPTSPTSPTTRPRAVRRRRRRRGRLRARGRARHRRPAEAGLQPGDVIIAIDGDDGRHRQPTWATPSAATSRATRSRSRSSATASARSSPSTLRRHHRTERVRAQPCSLAGPMSNVPNTPGCPRRHRAAGAAPRPREGRLPRPGRAPLGGPVRLRRPRR